MSNPNNCQTCDYKHMETPEGAHCYMYRHSPTQACPTHTGNIRKLPALPALLNLASNAATVDKEIHEALNKHFWELFDPVEKKQP